MDKTLDCTNLHEYLYKRRSEMNLYCNLFVNSDGLLERVFFVLSGAYELWERTQHAVLLYDTKHGTNRYGLKLGCITCMDEMGKTQVLAVSLVSNEDAESFSWVFGCFSEAFHSPVSLKEEWQRTAQDIAGLSIRGTEQSPTDKHSDDNPNSKKRSKTKVPLLDDTDKNSSTFTNATKQRCTTDGVVTIASWTKIPCPEDVTTNSNLRDPQPYIVIADEAHSMQSMASARTRDALRLVLAPNAVGVLLLTGTPVRQCSFGIVCVFANLKIQLAMVDK
jgi:MULE transposase domain